MSESQSGDFLDNLRVRVEDHDKSIGEIKTLIAMREERSKDIHEKVDKIYTLLIGDGAKDNPSVVTRIDRLEIAEDNRKFHLGVIYTGLVSLALESFREWLKR